MSDGHAATTLLDGKAVAAEVRAEVTRRAAAFASRAGRPPGLAVVLVGDDPASTVYVSTKEKACEKAGIRSFPHHLPASTPEGEVLALVRRLVDDDEVDGILVQLPLPRGLGENRVLAAVDPAKDVDGFHPDNVGLLALGRPRFVPCTPLGVMELLHRAGAVLRGREAVVVGRSRTVGLPVSLLLTAADATVTMAHSRTEDLDRHVARADVVVVAAGRPRLVPGSWVKPGSVVIDVGINREGGRLVGDVDLHGAMGRAAAITPVPGGVGPMTVAMLLANTVRAARLRTGLASVGDTKAPSYPPAW